MRNRRAFIIEVLDKEHVFIDSEQYSWLKAELEKVLDENVYRNPEQHNTIEL